MRKVIGIGETVLDIIFKDNQPVAAKPGGSTFNALISLGRTGVPVTFISETGNDKVGNIIVDFLKENNVNTRFVHRYNDGKSALSLAFLNAKNDADYTFYKDYPKQRIENDLPEINKDDIVLFGSFFALNPMLRSTVKALLNRAKENGAIIYYDPNFRSSHLDEIDELMPILEENFSYASIVRGSDEDFKNIFGTASFNESKQKLQKSCSNLIYTQSSKGVHVASKDVEKHYNVNTIKVLSTIGAGDNFNAGILYALLKYDIKKEELDNISDDRWNKMIEMAIRFSQNVCMSYDNYISNEFVKTLNK